VFPLQITDHAKLNAFEHASASSRWIVKTFLLPSKLPASTSGTCHFYNLHLWVPLWDLHY